MLAMFLLYFYWARRFWIGSIFWGISSTIGKLEWCMDAKEMHHLNESALCLWALLFSPFPFLEKLYIDIAMYYRGEQLIRYSNNIRITNIRIRIRQQIETRILFVFAFVQKFGSEYYLYSSQNLGLNIIRIRIHPKIWVQILSVFVFISFWKYAYYSLKYLATYIKTGVNKKPFSW